MKVISLLLLIFVIINSLEVIQKNDDKVEIWKGCYDVPVIGDTCLIIYYEKKGQNETYFGMQLTIQNHTLFDEEVQPHVCLDDESLLYLLELIPALKPFKKIIDAIILAKGHIPGEVFSICIDLKNLDVQPDEIVGDAYLDIILLCWKGECVWTGNEFLGHIDVPL